MAVAALAWVLLVLIGGLTLQRSSGESYPAMVHPGQSFVLEQSRGGTFSWSTRSVDAQSPSLRTLSFSEGEPVELRLVDGLQPGDMVEQGQEIARLYSPRAERRLKQLESEREAIQARRTLLLEGGRPEEIVAARKSLDIARAQRSQGQAELERLQKLQGQGAASAAALQQAELADQVALRQVDFALAQLTVAQAPARPEDLTVVEAQLATVDARIEEAQVILDAAPIVSPFRGRVWFQNPLPSEGIMIRVDDPDSAWLEVLVPQNHRSDFVLGSTLEFWPKLDDGDRFIARVSALPPHGDFLQGQTVFRVRARLESRLYLESGMTGQARLQPSEQGS